MFFGYNPNKYKNNRQNMLPKYTKDGNLFLNAHAYTHNLGAHPMVDRIAFTREQLSQIKASDEFKSFQEGDGNITLDTYLANEKNYSIWAEKFTPENKSNQEETTQTWAEIAAEEDLEASMDMGREGGPRNEGYENEVRKPKEEKVEEKPAKPMKGVILEDNDSKGLTVDEQEALDEIGKKSKDDLTPSEKGEFEKVLARIRSLRSDQNQNLFDIVTVEILHDMKEISDDDFNILLNNPDKMAEAAEKADSLSKENAAKFKVRLAEKVATNPELLSVTPPDVLTQSHDTLQQFIEVNKKKNPKADLTAYETNLATISGRMDELSDNMEDNVGLFLNDRTNIADTYQAYMDMFEAREKDLVKADDDASKEKVAKIKSNRETLDKIVGEYDEEWNLNGLEEKDADRINKRFDEASKMLPELKLSDETLALVSNYQFLDEAGKVTPQFIDPKDGSLHEKWSKGLEVDPKGKLAKVVSLAANDELLKTIGSKEDFNKQSLENGLNENLPFKLFAIHNSEELIKGVKEHPNKFTDPKFAEKFVQDLANSEKPMQISEVGYNAAIAYQDNAVKGYTQRLSKKIGNDKPVLAKLGGTMTNQETASEFRKRMAGKVLKRGLTSFGMATAFTIGTKAIGAKVGATAATAVGVGIGVSATAYMLYKRKKQAKKNGEKYGWKEFKKDRALQVAIATSTLAGVTAFCSMTGQTELAATFGTAAIVVGSGGSALEGYTESRKAGRGQLESIMWGGAMAAATYGGAQMGRMAGNAAVDAYNRAFGDNEIFQQKHETTKTETETKTETVYKDGAEANAEKTIGKWDSPEFKQNLESSFANADNTSVLQDSHLNPHRVALMSHYLGLEGTVDVSQHVQGGPDIVTKNHTCFANYDTFKAGLDGLEPSSDAYKALSSVTPEMYQAMQNSINPDGTVHLTADAVKGFEILDNHAIGAKGEITLPGHNGAAIQTDHVIGDNASKNPDGRYVADKNGDTYSTWIDAGGATQTTTVDVTTTSTETNFTQNEGATAIWGIVGKSHPLKKLKERMGALADRVMGKEPKDGVIGKTPKDPVDKGGVIGKTPKKPEEFNLDGLQGDNVAGVDGHVGIYHEVADLSVDEKNSTASKGEEISSKTGETAKKAPEAKKSIWKSISTWVSDKQKAAAQNKAQKAERKRFEERDARKAENRRNATPGEEFTGTQANFQPGENKQSSTPSEVLTQDKTGKVEENFQKTPEAKKSVWKSIKTWAKEKRDNIKETAAQKRASKQALIDKRDRQRNATPAGEFIGFDGSEMPNFQPGENPRGKKEEPSKAQPTQPKQLTQEQIEANLYKNINGL